MASIRLQGITKTFGDTRVLNAIDLDIADGEFLTLVGPSGCGKSTTLRIIAGLEAQTTGNVEIDGAVVNDIRPSRRDLVMVFQSHALYPHLTVRQNLATPLLLRDLGFWERFPLLGALVPGRREKVEALAATVREAAETLEIEHLLDRKPGQLSGGQRQRVALGRAMVRNPAAFLMDEPLSNLDAGLRVHMRAELAELHRNLGTTFVYVTHDQAEALTMSDRMAVMLDGDILQVGPPDEVYRNPRELRVAEFVGSPKINVMPGGCDGSGRLSCLGVALGQHFASPVGGTISIGLRPEYFALRPGNTSGCFVGRLVYPYSSLFDVTFERIMSLFKEAHPDIDVKFRATYDNYEDRTNTVLREAVADKLPDITFQGLNRQAILVEKGIAQSLEPFIAKEPDFSKEGYYQAILGLGTFGGQVHGLPFAVSLPVGYYNMDALKKAGITTLPQTWDEVVANCEKLRAVGYNNPLFWGWNITGNRFLQALLWSQDTPIIKDGKFNFDGPEGQQAIETMKKLFRGCKMLNLSVGDAGKPFAAGEVAMHFWSTSAVGAIERAKGDFELRTGEFPGIGEPPKGLPAGGNAAMLVSTSNDPKKIEAAWTFLKFCTSGTGAAAVAETTGYMPPNKAANELLADFYSKNPNKHTAVRQAGLLRDWIAYPGDNGLAITQVIYDQIESIVTGESEDMAALQEEIVEEVSSMLP